MGIKYADGNRGKRRERESANAVYVRGGGEGGGVSERERERWVGERQTEKERHTKGWLVGGG